MKKILILTLMLIMLIPNNTQAYILNGVEVPDKVVDYMQKPYVIAGRVGDNFIILNSTSLLNYNDIYGYTNAYCITNIMSVTYSKVVYNYTNDTVTTSTIRGDANTGLPINNIQLSNFDVKAYQSKNLVFSGNYSSNMSISHGDRYSFTNVGNTIMYNKVTFQKSLPADTITLVMTDQNGNFKEQMNVSSETLTFDVEIKPSETRNIYFYFNDPTAQVDKASHYLTFKFLNQTYIKWEKYIPKYRITGGTTIKLQGLEIPNQVPYIKPNTYTEIIYKYNDNGNGIIKSQMLQANEKFNFNVNTEYLIKFIHETTKTIYVESNFSLHDTSERISLESDESLKEQILSNGGSIIESSPQDYAYQLNSMKDMKITNLKTKNVLGIGEIIQAYITGSANSNLKIHGYGYDGETLYKKFEYYLDSSNMGKAFAISISPQEFIVLEETSGTSTVTIRAKYKIDTDFSVEYYQGGYPFDETIEGNYSVTNPSPKNVGGIKDMYVEPVATNLWDSLANGSTFDWTGINSSNNELENAKQAVGKVSSFGEIFIEPVTRFFTGMPDIYYLIIFAFGLSIVLLILGR